jgi:hypothetical protein
VFFFTSSLLSLYFSSFLFLSSFPHSLSLSLSLSLFTALEMTRFSLARDRSNAACWILLILLQTSKKEYRNALSTCILANQECPDDFKYD